MTLAVTLCDNKKSEPWILPDVVSHYFHFCDFENSRLQLHGQRRTQHQRFPILFVHGRYLVVGWKARRLWVCCGGNECYQNGRIRGIRIWKDQRQGYCQELRSTGIRMRKQNIGSKQRQLRFYNALLNLCLR